MIILPEVISSLEFSADFFGLFAERRHGAIATLGLRE
jgi:hypothetical protein